MTLETTNPTKHGWWGFKCKTPTCNWWNAMKYIGLADGRPIHLLPDEMPGNFTFRCDGCGKAHHYIRKELQVQKADDPPPPEWADRF